MQSAKGGSFPGGLHYHTPVPNNQQFCLVPNLSYNLLEKGLLLLIRCIV